MADDIRDNSWHLDKRVPIALIFTMLVQFAAGIWWVADINGRVYYIERERDRNSNLSGEIIQIKEQLRGIERIIGRLENYLDRRKQLQEELGKSNPEEQ